MSPMIRVAAAQFCVGTDAEANKAKVLEMIDQALALAPKLLVLPEFCNHASWYLDQEHCWQVALDLADPWWDLIAARAKASSCYIVVNATIRREGRAVTGSSLMFGEDGLLLAISDKQVLIGHENFFLTPASQRSPVVETAIGRLGLYACMDGVIAETPRDLACRGAEILCNSLNSFALDEASLHVPVRAAENKVLVVAANKVGPLIPEDQLDAVSAALHIPRHFLFGAGESQILAPDGTVLAKASAVGEEIISALVSADWAKDKLRPDGSDIMATRRPALYQAIGGKPEDLSFPSVLRSLKVACWQGQGQGHTAIMELVAALPILEAQCELVVLPELFFANDYAAVTAAELPALLDLSRTALTLLQQALAGRSLQLVMSVVLPGPERPRHAVVLLDQDGVKAEQSQLHRSALFGADIELGCGLNSCEHAAGRIALLCGADAVFPEVFRVLALKGVSLVLVSGQVQESWETSTGLLERAAENRMHLAYASRPHIAGASIICELEADFTLMTAWQQRQFDGQISRPRLHAAPRFAAILQRTLDLKLATNKVLSGTTDVLASRPWKLWPAFA